MRRSSERLIDVLVLAMLLLFSWGMRDAQPALAGVVIAAATQFWLAKNATESSDSIERAAAVAAAEVLKVARLAAPSDHSNPQGKGQP